MRTGAFARAAAPCVLLALLAVAAFRPALRNDFVNLDDPALVLEHLSVMEGPPGQVLRWAFTETSGRNWFPLTRLSHALDARLFGDAAWGHHLTSLLLHALNAALLYLVLRGATGSSGRSLLVAALFAVHPLQAETVAWVAERSNALSALFWFLTVGAYIHYTRAPSPARLLAVVGLFACGLLAKPTLVVLPLTLLAFDLWPLGRMTTPGPPPATRSAGPRPGPGRLLAEKAPLFLLAALCAAFVFRLQASTGAVRTLEQLPLADRLRALPANLATPLLKGAWPAGLHPYRLHPGDTWSSLETALAAAALAGITALAARGLRRRPHLAAGWLWYFAALLPAVGLVQAGARGIADRFAYVSLVGAWWMVAWSLPALPRRGARGSAAFAAAAVLLLAALANRQARFWRDTEALAGHALASQPENYLARNNLASTRFQAGDYDGAIRETLVLVEQRPAWAAPRANLAIALDARGDAAGAVHHLRRALALEPGNAANRRRLEAIVARQAAALEALAAARGVADARPRDAPARRDLAVALADAGRYPEAAAELRAALALDPVLPDAARILAAVAAWRPNAEEAAFRARDRGNDAAAAPGP